MKQVKVVLVGCGGIGSWLVEPLSRYLNYSSHEMVEIQFVDGDAFEDKNLNRQLADQMENKAHVLARRAKTLDRLSVRARSVYLIEENIGSIIQEGHIVLVAVDNNATRKLISEHASTLRDVLVICGGNDEYDGSLLVYYRKDGKNLSHPLTIRPEIQNPTDENPGNVHQRVAGCDMIVDTVPQLICANFMAASMMLNAFVTILDYPDKWPGYDDGAFDTRTNNAKSQRRVRSAGTKPS